VSILLEQLESRARLTPGAIAIRSASAALSFARLWADVNAVAHKLRSRQVSSLGIYLDNGIEWIVVDLAAIAAGQRNDLHTVPVGRIDRTDHVWRVA